MLSLRNISITFRNFGLRDVSFDVESGSYFVLVGPTGSGKTVLLETIAGLQPAHGGRVLLDGRDITDLEPQRRRIGLVFQDYALFPHLSVRNNIAFGLRLRKMSGRQVNELVSQTASLVRVQHLLERRVGRLSGGEKQKVALARSLVLQPDVLLLDEPLSALDPESREMLQDDLRRLHGRLKTTVVHVTHDFSEAMSMADVIGVLGESKVQQIGTPVEIFRKPASIFVARFTMTKNIFRGEIRRTEGCSVFCADGATFEVPEHIAGPCFAVIRPEEIRLSREPVRLAGFNTVRSVIGNIIDTGVMITAITHSPTFHCLLPRDTFEAADLRIGQEAYVFFRPESVSLLDR